MKLRFPALAPMACAFLLFGVNPSYAQTLPTIRVGETVNGRLASSMPRLPDGSHYLLYRFRGQPGEQIVITMRSGEFDTFLTWGRFQAGAFRAEASDDDGGGGTDSELTVTVGQGGDYAIRANSYAAGETGAFTLSIRRAPPGRPETTQAPRGGAWQPAYAEPRSTSLRGIHQRMQQQRLLEGIAARLNANFPLPRDVAMRMDQCGQPGAFFDSSRNLIVFCYEMVDHLTTYFAADGEGSRKQEEAIEGAISFIIMHEVGHALVTLFDLPITGREEDAVDQLATLLMLDTGEKGTRAALSAMLALQPEEGEEIDEDDYAGVHSLSPQRLYNVMCWIYATDPPRYGPLVGQFLPDFRLARCPDEFTRFSRAWERLLAPHRVIQ